MSTKTQNTSKVTKKTIAPIKPVETVTVKIEPEIPKADLESDITEKRKLSRDTILESFEDLIKSVEDEINSLRESDTKTKGIKFLRTVNKRIKILKNQSSKLIKQKRNNGKTGVVNKNSGFLKPVPISTEMAKFTGWNMGEPKSRVEVTKYICNYIKEHKLQNPEDKRQINVDSKLSKLLRYDPKKESEPLTYYKIQSNLKHHFPKAESVAV